MLVVIISAISYYRVQDRTKPTFKYDFNLPTKKYDFVGGPEPKTNMNY